MLRPSATGPVRRKTIREETHQAVRNESREETAVIKKVLINDVIEGRKKAQRSNTSKGTMNTDGVEPDPCFS